jgi:hypothetical protein
VVVFVENRLEPRKGLGFAVVVVVVVVELPSIEKTDFCAGSNDVGVSPEFLSSSDVFFFLSNKLVPPNGFGFACCCSEEEVVKALFQKLTFGAGLIVDPNMDCMGFPLGEVAGAAAKLIFANGLEFSSGDVAVSAVSKVFPKEYGAGEAVVLESFASGVGAEILVKGLLFAVGVAVVAALVDPNEVSPSAAFVAGALLLERRDEAVEEDAGVGVFLSGTNWTAANGLAFGFDTVSVAVVNPNSDLGTGTGAGVVAPKGAACVLPSSFVVGVDSEVCPVVCPLLLILLDVFVSGTNLTLANGFDVAFGAASVVFVIAATTGLVAAAGVAPK